MWQTPVADDAVERAKGKYNSRGEPKLSAEVLLWPTPNTAPERPCEGNVRMLRQKVLAGDMTETEARAMLGGKSPFEAQGIIPAMASTAQQNRIWATPTVQDASNNGGPSQHERNALPLNAQVGGALSPDWVEWLMGWPVGWTSLEPMTELGSWFDETWWNEEPVPRITTNKTNRTKRLKAIGNGQVPACVVSAWLTLGVMVASEGTYEGHHQGQG